MSDWRDLMATFGLEDEVAGFVRQRVKELVSDRHDFHYSGSAAGRAYCDAQGPHPPHVTGEYQTVRWGNLQKYCLGEEGETPEGRLHIVVTERELGDPAWPSMARGFWWVEPAQTAAEAVA